MLPTAFRGHSVSPYTSRTLRRFRRLALAAAATTGAPAAAQQPAQQPVQQTARPAAHDAPAACSASAAVPNARPSAAPFAYDRAAPLALRDSLDRVVRGVAVHRVSFDSPRGGRATGWL